MFFNDDESWNVIQFFQHFYSATNQLVLRCGGPKQGPMSDACLQEACGQGNRSLQRDPSDSHVVSAPVDS